MRRNTTVLVPWSMPFCPAPPEWRCDWEGIEARFPWIRAMGGVPQDPAYHAEGDVRVHTRMVVEALIRLDAWRELSPMERSSLFAAALLHDVAKSLCTTTEADGQIHARGHARRGESIAREMLWRGENLNSPVSFLERERIARLVRLHGLPLWFLERPQPERALIEASQSVGLDFVALLAEADVLGRECDDREALRERVALFRELAREQGCFDRPRAFPSDHSRFLFFRGRGNDPDYEAYDDTRFEVVLMSGLPGVGKDRWIRESLPEWPVISLDQIRAETGIAPDVDQAPVVRIARERARAYLRSEQPFVWNATNITRAVRGPLIDLFTSYRARVRIVYVDAPYDVLRQRNQDRARVVPESILDRLGRKLEVPEVTEAHAVEHVEN